MHPDIRVRERSFGDWEGIPVEELAQRYPEDYRSWAEFRGGELKYGAEPKEEVGRRGVEALNDWAFRAGSDTDLYVFSHGAWISQTLQTLLGMADAHGDFADILSMRNAHWGAAHSIGDRFHIALAFDGLQSRSRYRRFRGMEHPSL